MRVLRCLVPLVAVMALALALPAEAQYPVVNSTVTTGPCTSGDSSDDTAIWIHPTDTSLSRVIAGRRSVPEGRCQLTRT